MIADVSIVDVWQRLGGGPIRRGRAAAWWRGGDGANIAIDAERGVWWDHARNVGGGMLDLVQTVRECDKRDVIRWLCMQGLIADRDLSAAERHRLAGRSAALDAAALNIGCWLRGRTIELERDKANAAVCNDESALAASSNALYRLTADGAAVVAAYREHLARDPEGVRKLIGSAREDDRRAQAITAALVCLLAKVGTSDHA
jgi:hypothetical protein